MLDPLDKSNRFGVVSHIKVQIDFMAMVAINPPCPNKNLVEHLPHVGGSTAQAVVLSTSCKLIQGKGLPADGILSPGNVFAARKDTTIPKKNGVFMRF